MPRLLPGYRLYNESCFDTFRRIASSSIDMVCVDPPYGTTQCKWDSIISLEPMWVELKRIVKPNSAIVVMACEPFTANLIMSNAKMFRHRWIWIKGKTKTGFLDASRRPLRTFEDVVVFGIKPPRYFPQMNKGSYYSAMCLARLLLTVSRRWFFYARHNNNLLALSRRVSICRVWRIGYVYANASRPDQ